MGDFRKVRLTQFALAQLRKSGLYAVVLEQVGEHMLPLVSSQQDALANIRHFEAELARNPALQSRLGFARAWYAFQDADGRWRFGPSKFIGYRGIDAEQYLATAQNLDGRRTEARLRQWFTLLSHGSKLSQKLDHELWLFLAKYGRTPSAKMRINVTKDARALKSPEVRDTQNDAIVNLLIAVAKSLPAVHQAKLRSALNS